MKLPTKPTKTHERNVRAGCGLPKGSCWLRRRRYMHAIGWGRFRGAPPDKCTNNKRHS